MTNSRSAQSFCVVVQSSCSRTINALAASRIRSGIFVRSLSKIARKYGARQSDTSAEDNVKESIFLEGVSSEVWSCGWIMGISSTAS